MTTETNRDRFDAWPMAPMSTKSTKRFFLGGAISINNTPPTTPTKVFCTPSVFLKSDDVKRAEEEEEENFLFFGEGTDVLFRGTGMYVCTLTVL